MAYIYSTCTSSHNINGVLINGGHGLPNAHLWTPKGVATKVTEAQLKTLKEAQVFNALVAAGLFLVSAKKIEEGKAARDMTDRDNSALRTDADFVEAPVVNK